MIKITAHSDLKIEGLQEDEKLLIQNNLTLLNPKWDMATRMNLSLWGVPQKLKYYREDNGVLIVPIGIIDDIRKQFKNAKFVDKRVHTKTSPILFTGKLRDYQETAVEDLKKTTNGVLCMKTGGGKTQCAIKLMCDLKLKTLILVHTQELALQFRDRIITTTNLKSEDIGLLGMGKKIVKPITIGLLQTVTMLPDIGKLDFGLIICDETHIVPANTYADALSKLPAKYKYGMSATPARTDGLTKVIFWLTGPLVHTVPDEHLTNVIVKPTIKTLDTQYYFPLFDTSEYQHMITDLSESAERNKLILTELANYKTQQCVLLCQRKEQVHYLQKHIPDSVILTSDMSKKNRALVMEGLLSRKHRIVISTFQLFSTGIDIPTLEVLFICAPLKSVIKLKQAAGRLMRTTKLLPNKKPIIVDFADKRVELLKYQWYQRSKTLRTL